MNFCRADGDLCQLDTDCCNHSCDPTTGRCRAAGSCAEQNDPCGGVRSCCDTLCVPNSQNLGYCTAIGGCRVQGEPCVADLDCCSDYVNGTLHPGACAADSSGVKRCQKMTPCLADGEVCGGQGASQNCCAAQGNQKNCWPTSSGVSRCFAKGVCLDAGTAANPTPCTVPDECCSGICVPNPNSPTGFGCQGACLPVGGQACSAMTCGAGLSCVNNVCVDDPPCTADADCCTGGQCQNGTCVTTGQTCSPIGGTCKSTADCCEGTCTGGFCQNAA